MLANERQMLFDRRVVLDIKHKRHVAALSVFAAGYLISMVMPALAQDAVKPPEKWRPRDGDYIVPAEHSATEDPCRTTGDFQIAFRKKWFNAGEAFGCKINKVTDVTKDALRLDLDCDEDGSGGDPKDVHWQKEIAKLRRIDENSFAMHMTKDGKKDSWSEWRLRYWRAPKGC